MTRRGKPYQGEECECRAGTIALKSNADVSGTLSNHADTGGFPSKHCSARLVTLVFCKLHLCRRRMYESMRGSMYGSMYDSMYDSMYESIIGSVYES